MAISAYRRFLYVRFYMSFARSVPTTNCSVHESRYRRCHNRHIESSSGEPKRDFSDKPVCLDFRVQFPHARAKFGACFEATRSFINFVISYKKNREEIRKEHMMIMSFELPGNFELHPERKIARIYTREHASRLEDDRFPSPARG